MKVKVNLITAPRRDPIEAEIAPGITLAELAKQYKDATEYQTMAAKVNGIVTELTEKIYGPCTVELIDVRDIDGNYIYQHSLSLIYLKAAGDVLGDVHIEIMNSLSKGLFTRIWDKDFKLMNISEEEADAIEKRMREITDADLPILKEECSKEETIKIFREKNHAEKEKLLDATKHTKTFVFYEIDGYKNYFYGDMVPSAGYIQYYGLKKYKDGVIVRFPYPSKPEEMPAYKPQPVLYEAFEDAQDWGRLLGIKFVADLNEKVKNGEYEDLILLSEALHEKRIAHIADVIKESGKRIVLIAGPSSSGKTTFARRLCIQLRVVGLKPLYLGTDDYFVERNQTPLDEYGEPDFERLEAVDVELFNRDMNDLLAGKEVDIPVFDFLEGKKIFGKRITKLADDQIIVIEGIHALNEAMTPHISKDNKFKVYISPLTQLNIDAHNRIPTTDQRMLRRMVRDYRTRGHSAQDTINGWPKVRTGEDKYVFPYNKEADIMFNSVHLYEFAVLKKYVEPLLLAIRPEEPEYSIAKRILKFLDLFESIEDDSVIANNSILREFIGGSIFR